MPSCIVTTPPGVLSLVGKTTIERARYEATISPKAGGDVKKESGKHIVVYRRRADGSWKVLWEIWNSDR
jgi:ketosteroid isomerase-like protein